jgi:ATP-dependent RNA helicase RhlE
MSFTQFNLDPKLNTNIAACGYTAPTPIQLQAIPEVLTGRDLMGLAQTGTGKTAAFVLPMLQRLLAGPRKRVRALVIAPTRELAEQIHENIIELGRHTGLRSVTVYGGVGKGGQIQMFKAGAEIIVACPGRLLDHLDCGDLDLSHAEVLVLDEADMMFDMGFLPTIKRILKRLPEKRQNLMFSATMPPPIRVLADQILNNPLTVKVGHEKPADTVSHILYRVEQKGKGTLLKSLMKEIAMDSALVFTRTKYGAKNLAVALEKAGHQAVALQGNMSQNKRKEAMEGFKKGDYKVLVATDIAARGIDVSGISHVINYDVPDTVEAYTHRTGRTGRAMRLGEAITFATGEDQVFIRQVEAKLTAKMERRETPASLSVADLTEAVDVTVRPDGDSRGGRFGRNGQGRGGQARGARSAPPRAPRVAATAVRKPFHGDGAEARNQSGQAAALGQDGGPVWRPEPSTRGGQKPGAPWQTRNADAGSSARPTGRGNQGRGGRRAAPLGLNFSKRSGSGGDSNGRDRV